jgi:hypothetical protein
MQRTQSNDFEHSCVFVVLDPSGKFDHIRKKAANRLIRRGHSVLVGLRGARRQRLKTIWLPKSAEAR